MSIPLELDLEQVGKIAADAQRELEEIYKAFAWGPAPKISAGLVVHVLRAYEKAKATGAPIQ